MTPPTSPSSYRNHVRHGTTGDATHHPGTPKGYKRDKEGEAGLGKF